MRRFGLLLAPTLISLITMAFCIASTGPAGGRAAPSPIASSPSGASSPWAPLATSAAALVLCRDALPSRQVVSGAWTTVDALRGWGYGGPVQNRPLSDAFPSAVPSDQAAWCWTRDAPHTYTAWAVRAPDGAVHAMTISEIGATDSTPTEPTPSGPPLVP
jgi:hypothetical protein